MSTTTRRSALRGSAMASLAALATLGIPPVAKAALTRPDFGPDAQLIATCAKMVALEGEFDQLFDRRLTIEIEEQTEPELLVLFDRKDQIKAEFDDLELPTTLPGVIALAEMFLAIGPRDSDGELRPEGFDDWCAYSICEVLAGLRKEGAV